MTEIKIVDGKYIVEGNVDIFVIPNMAYPLDLHHSFGLEKAMSVNEIANLNGFTFDAVDDKMVQLWWTSKEEMGSENLGDHGLTLLDPNGNKVYVSYLASVLEYLPAKWFENLHEGETMQIKIPYRFAKCDCGDDQFHEDFEFRFTVRAAQADYRYRNYRTFEGCLRAVQG